MARLFRLLCFLFTCVALPPALSAQWNPLNPVRSSQRDISSLTLFLEKGALRFQVCTDSMIRVLFSPEHGFPKVTEYVVIKSEWPQIHFEVSESPDAITLITSKLKLAVTKKDSVIIFYDSAGNKLAQENDRTLTPVEVNGE